MPLQIHPGENAIIKFPLFQLGPDLTWKGLWDYTTPYVPNDVVLGPERPAGTFGPAILSAPLIVGHTYYIFSYVNPDDFTNVGASGPGNLVFTATGTTPATWSNGSILYEWNGRLEIGHRYLIFGYSPGDDFTNVGAGSNANGVFFTATGTTPNVWGGGHSPSNLFQVDGFSVAYKNLTAISGTPPPWPGYWQALPLELAASIKSFLLELVDAADKAVVSWLYRIVGSQLTSGALVVGKQYEIVTFNAGDDFSNVGASSNASGVFFTATNTTPTTWSNSSVLQQVEYPSNVLPADGMMKFELLDDDTRQLGAGVYELRASVKWLDADYFASGGQTDVLCLDDMLEIVPC